MVRCVVALLILVLVPVADAGAVGGGRPAPEGRYPSAVVVEIGQPGTTTTTCGGTLIAPTWVLTAGHCVILPGGATYPVPYVHVIAGRYHRSNAAEGMVVNAARVIPNPSYAGAVYVNARYPDVALIELAQAVPYPTTRVVGPSERALWSRDATATVVGWGTDGTTSGPSETPNEADLTIHSDDDCATMFAGSSVNIGNTTVVSTSRWDATNMLCAGDNFAGPCSGDSGSPLFVRVPGPVPVLRIAGVASEGSTCPSTGIFTRVGEPAISSWIASLVPDTIGP